jgi:hypothetical protein
MASFSIPTIVEVGGAADGCAGGAGMERFWARSGRAKANTPAKIASTILMLPLLPRAIPLASVERETTSPSESIDTIMWIHHARMDSAPRFWIAISHPDAG